MIVMYGLWGSATNRGHGILEVRLNIGQFWGVLLLDGSLLVFSAASFYIAAPCIACLGVDKNEVSP